MKCLSLILSILFSCQILAAGVSSSGGRGGSFQTPSFRLATAKKILGKREILNHINQVVIEGQSSFEPQKRSIQFDGILFSKAQPRGFWVTYDLIFSGWYQKQLLECKTTVAYKTFPAGEIQTWGTTCPVYDSFTHCHCPRTYKPIEIDGRKYNNACFAQCHGENMLQAKEL